MRQAKLAEFLAADGHDTSAFALDKLRVIDGVRQCGTAKEAAEGADVCVLPLPAASREGMLTTPLSSGLHTVREILSALSPGQTIFAGRLDAQTAEVAGAMGLSVGDYFLREELAVSNAVAAVEGAIKIMIEETPVTLWRSGCLIIGFGRIGKLLAHRLRALGMRVTATARKCSDLAWIRAYGYEAVETAAVGSVVGDYDFIVNTVPSRVLGASRLPNIRRDALLLDLASKPGGIDFAAAAKLGVHAVWALSLPGEVAPVTSGAVIRDTLYNIMREKGLPL
jgi:dipicolinate synthase subunit A